MSLGVVIKGPEGVVLAADSRVTLEAQRAAGDRFVVNFDNATKLLTFTTPHTYVAAVTYGNAVIGLRTAHSFVPEFEIALPPDRTTVQAYAATLSDFFAERWREANLPATAAGMTFIVGGYDPGAAYGNVFIFEIPNNPAPQERNPGDGNFGMTWGGQLEIASRIVSGYDPALLPLVQTTLGATDAQIATLRTAIAQNLGFKIPYNVLPLQDCVDLATFMIRTTITAQALAIGVRGVGGPIDVATISRTGGLQYVQRKTIHGEQA